MKLTEKQIAAYEAKGFKRWTKGNMDRLYINVQQLGAEVDYYNTGNVRYAEWQGEQVSNADGRRLLASKVWIDVETGELHVRTEFNFGHHDDVKSVEDAAREYVAAIDAELRDETSLVIDDGRKETAMLEVFDFGMCDWESGFDAEAEMLVCAETNVVTDKRYAIVPKSWDDGRIIEELDMAMRRTFGKSAVVTGYDDASVLYAG